MKLKAFTGIMMTLFLATTLFAAIPIRAHPGWDGEIHIAVVGPQGWIQWDGQWVGTVLAAEIVNLGPNLVDEGGDGDDGIIIGGKNYKVVLTDVNSHAAGEPDPVAGWAELLAALEPPFSADFVIGGFRTECVGPMRINFIDYAKAEYDTTEYAPIWFIAGASTDELIDCGGTGKCEGTCTRCNYAKGRYMFRVTPMNGTTLLKQFGLGVIRSYVLPTRLYRLYNTPEVIQGPVKTAIVAEDLTWTETMTKVLAGSDWYPGYPPSPPSPYSILGTQCEVVAVHRVHALNPIFEPVFDDIDAKNVRLIIQIFSGPGGVPFVTTYRDRLTNAVPVGINVESQLQEFWERSDGKCEYESFLATMGTRNNVNPDYKPYNTEQLWDLYKARSGQILTDFWGIPKPSTYPIYTFWGSYDAILGLEETLEKATSWPIKADTLIPLLEQTDRTGAMGKFKYTGPNGIYHDMFCAPDVLAATWESYRVRSLIPQWQEGELRTYWPQDQPYSRRYRIPPWMYELETDLTYNGVVDIADVMIPAIAFGAYPGLPEWNIEADFTADGLVDIADVIKVAIHFGDWVPFPLPM